MIAVLEQYAHFCFFFIHVFTRVKDAVHLPVGDRDGISVIICAKNEADNLAANLPLVMSQHYATATGVPLFEVVVVNDHSNDGTEKILSALAEKYPDMLVIDHSADAANGKKPAQYSGVLAAKFDQLVFIDADCRPAGPEWLARIAQPLFNGKAIVAGYGGYDSTPGPLNAFIRWETLHTFLLYSSYIQSGQPYMAVGRNMACSRSIYLQTAATELWNSLPYGDDDLLVAIAGTPDNTAAVRHAASFTYTRAKTTLKAWVAQKQRHLSTGKYYKRFTRYLIGEYAVSHALLWVTFLTLLCFRHQWLSHNRTHLIVELMAVRCALYYMAWGRTASIINERKLIFFFPCFDLGWMIYNFVFSPFIFFKNKTNWK